MSKLALLEKHRSAAAEAAAAAVIEAESTTVIRPTAMIASAAPLPSMPEIASSPKKNEDVLIERITITIPVDLLDEIEARLSQMKRRERVSLSGYFEAALRELLLKGEADLKALKKHGISKRRKL